MKINILITFLFFSFFAKAQTFIEPCKYGQPLINALQNSYSPTQTLGYNLARDILYAQIDNDGNDLRGIYTDFKVILDPTQDPSQSAFQNGNGINAEHVYPQSKGAASEPMRSDMHNIYPSKVNVNASRGNCRFGEVADSQTDHWFYLSSDLTSIPASDIDNYSEKEEQTCVFEPRESVKGNIARAVFYFYATYQNTANSADANFFNSQKNTLLQWHQADPVDSLENVRNQLIANQQGNLNPFSIDSSLARRAFFMADASYTVGNEGCADVATATQRFETATDWVRLRTNFVSNDLIIISEINNGQVQIFDLTGRLLAEEGLQRQTKVNVQELNNGFYLAVITADNGHKATFKFFVY